MKYDAIKGLYSSVFEINTGKIKLTVYGVEMGASPGGLCTVIATAWKGRLVTKTISVPTQFIKSKKQYAKI